MRNNWDNVYKTQKILQQKIRNNKGVAEYFSDKPAVGYMKDNISKKQVLIADCKDSTLRRYVKLLTKYFKLVSTPAERTEINNKLTEVTTELEKRDSVNK